MRMRSFAGHFRDQFIRGLLVVLPLLITVWLVRFLFRVVSDNMTPAVMAVLAASGVPDLESLHVRFLVSLFGLVLTFLLIYLVGVSAGNLLGRRAVALVESYILKVPLVKSIYGAARQLLDAFTVGGSGAFSRVVLVEYPRAGAWTLGFVTKEFDGASLPPQAGSSQRTLLVFLPTTPNPTSGWLVALPAADALEIDLSVEEGIKLIVSGGIVAPDDFVARVRARGVVAGGGSAGAA